MADPGVFCKPVEARHAQHITMPITTALLYTRVSSDEQARDGLSLEAQMADCRQYAQRHEWVIGDELVDVLAGTRDDRVQYQRMLSEVRSRRARGESVVIVVAELSRLGRKLLEGVRSREELKGLGVAVHSVRDGGEVSDLIANIITSVAQEEVRRLGERVSASRRYTRERGWVPVGTAAWGYRWRPATPEERSQGAPASVREIHPEQGPLVVEAFTRIARGATLQSVVKWVETLSYEQRGGRKLGYRAVWKMLRSAWYLPRERDPEAPLIPPELWERTQAQLADHRLAHQASGRYLLSGILRCPRCGTGLIGNYMNTHPNPVYRCPAGHNSPGARCGWSCVMPPLDALVRSAVMAWLAVADHPSSLAILRSEWQARQRLSWATAGPPSQLRQLQREIEHEHATLIALTRQYAQGEIDQLSYQLTRDATLARLRAAELALVSVEEYATPPSLPDWSVVAKLLRTAALVLQGDSIAPQRRLLVDLIVQGVPHIVGYRRYRVDLTPTPLGAWLQEWAARHGIDHSAETK